MKKHIGKITTLVALLLILVTSIACFTIFSAETSNPEVSVNWSFEIITASDGTKSARITGATITGDYTRSVNIPSVYVKDEVEYPVTEIKSGAFNGKTQIFGPLTIPEGITKIGENAFKGTQIYGEVVIPSTVTSIGYSAFENCKGITSVVLPEGLKTLESYTFKNCTALRKINIDKVTELKLECFRDCYALYDITLSDSIQTIGNSVFYQCYSLDQLFDISSVTSLGTNVFYNCKRIEGFIMPNVSFDLAFFSGCSGVKYYEVKEGNEKYITIDGVIFDKTDNGATLLLYPANKDGSVYTIPSQVTTIGRAAFAYAVNLETVIIGDKVTSISPEAFKQSSLTHAYIPDNFYSVSVDLFKSCKNLEWVVLGKNVATVGIDSFKDTNTSVKVIAKNPNVSKPDYVNASNFISLKNYQCIDHYYGYNDKPATCEEYGYRECIVCGRNTYEKELGHSGMIIETSELSCDTDEYIVIDCLRCGEQVKEVSQTCTGHKTLTQVVVATESSPGYTKHFCYVCNETYIEDYCTFVGVEKCKSHKSFVEFKVSEDSCKTNGLSLYSCKDCGYLVRELPSAKKDCSFEVVSDIASSCTIEGVLVEKCAVCGTEKVTNRPLIEHDHYWYTISEKQGYEYSTCKRCGLFESNKVDYSVLNSLIGQVSQYYQTYYAPETVALIKPILESQGLNLTQEAVDYNAEILGNALANISYNVTDVPVVFIEKIGDLSREYTDARIYIAYMDENGKSCVEAIEYNATMKYRGNSTANSTKYPYNIKFSSKVDLFGMGAGKKYCLLANLYDQTLMRNALAIEFSQAIDIQYAPSYEFVEVYYNGTYGGLYMLTTPMDIGEDRIDIDEESDYLFELENKSNGEYYLKSPIFGINCLIEDTNDLSGDAFSMMYVYYNMIDFAIKSGDWELINQYIDIESVAKYYVIHEYLKEVDICYDSTRFYIKDGKLHGGPVWDFDLGMGNIGDQGGDNSSHSAYNNKGSYADTLEGIEGNSATGYWADCRWGNKNIWFPYLIQYSPEFYDAIQDVLITYVEEMRLMYEDKIINKRETIENKIDIHNHNEAFTAARIRNYRKFTIAHAYSSMSHIENSYSEAINYLRSWFEQRHAWMYEAYIGEALPDA